MNIPGTRPRVVRVLVHQDLLDRSQRQVDASPEAETGGKFLGFIIDGKSRPPNSRYGQTVAKFWDDWAKNGPALLLVASISSGPRAKCSPTSLVPDAEFQATVFRAIERGEREIEHLGSWHSHHPNGLREFSSGDIEHYSSVISDSNYNPNFFVAGLCFDARGLSGGIFELFERKGKHRKKLGSEQVTVVSEFPSLQSEIDKIEYEIISRSSFGKPYQPSDLQLESQLAERFRIKNRTADEDSISWVVESRSDSNFLGVVTQTQGPEPHVAVSLETASPASSLRFDGVATVGELQSLHRGLEDAVRNIERIFRVR